MQEIEAAIGEADAQALAAPFGKPFVEHRAVEHDLVFQRGRGGRQQAMAQFVDVHGRGAALADHDRRARIGGAHRGLVVGAERQHHAENGDTVSPAPDTSRTLTG